MAEEAVTGNIPKVPKPKLRGWHGSMIKRNLGVASILVAGVAIALKFLHNDPKMHDYAAFYK
jgi:hypothetical protein